MPENPAPFSQRRWLHNAHRSEGWGHTGNIWQQAGTADECQRHPAKPWRDAISNLDAPHWVPSFQVFFSGGMVLPQYQERP